jgi:FixJ family two-component response regulator
LADDTKIFVIDDDESVRISLGRLLHSAGYHCIALASGDEFLQLLRSDTSAGDAACAIVDICMPGMDGIELTHRLRCRHPMLPVVLITASRDEYSESVFSGDPIVLLQKPFDDLTLFAAISASARGDRRVHHK